MGDLLPEPPKNTSRIRASFPSGLDFLDDSRVHYEEALIQTKFGKFHFMLMTVCGLIYLNTAVGITILSFVLPSATCDFQMTSKDKGLLTAAPMLGMVIGSYFWGCLADTRGRKYALIAALLLDGLCGLLSSISQFYSLFLFFRFCNGFAITGAMGICFPYLGEFQPTKYREKILCWMELFWTVGIILLPLIAWLIIPMDFNYMYGTLKFSSWNLFVAVCALPSLLIGMWLFFFPESPKFLMECGEADSALEILKDMFYKNTGVNRDAYPIKSLIEKNQSENHSQSLRSLNIRNPRHLRILFSEVWEQTKALCRPPHRRNTALACSIQFGLTTSYYTLMVWFPELFYRFEEFESRYPGQPATLNDVSSIILSNGTDQFCGEPMDSTVFIHTVYIGLACIPTSIWLGLCIHKLGAKFFIIFSMFVAGFVTIGFYYVNSSLQNLMLSCIFEALTSLGISTVYCVMVDLFPTNLRVMAAALSLTFGRGGALLGNVLFGYLIDLNAIVPIVTFSMMLFISGILCCFLPATGNEALD